ncbi:MAG TPA: hypothetical protein VJ936_03335 [Desulfobacteraceae bacterium]|nr:hypothetical protein [Desulfobacteraceae bacterium]
MIAAGIQAKGIGEMMRTYPVMVPCRFFAKKETDWQAGRQAGRKTIIIRWV